MGRKEDREAWTKKINRDLIARNAKPITRSKYGAVKTDAGGKRFDSAKEAKRYLDLAMLQAAGAISALRLQTHWPLRVACESLPDRPIVLWPIGDYVSDFDYVENGTHIVEDVKGMKTALYRWKKKHVEAQYGFTILET